MSITIRTERMEDQRVVASVIERAFLNAEHSDGNEAELVERLRRSSDFIADLSLVAEVDGAVVGHILLTKITIVGISERSHASLALAPVSVSPEFQNQGIGAALIKRSHEVAKRLGFGSVILLGHPDYYPRFGYQKASQFGIRPPFEVPDAAFMALELTEKGLAIHAFDCTVDCSIQPS